MDSSKRLRVLGLFITLIGILYYIFQIYLYFSHWYSLNKIQDMTSCDQIFTIELWLLSQDCLWLLSLLLLVIVLAKPELYKLLLCFLYLMGPVYFTWTVVAIGYYSTFLACCKEEQDDCTGFYPYSKPASFILLLIVSLVFSALIGVYLIALVVHSLWRYLSARFSHYTDLIS